MKKIILSALVLISLQANAGEMILDQGPAGEPSPFCERYSRDIVAKIYVYASSALKHYGDLLENYRVANTDCNNRYAKAANRDIGITIKEGQAIYAQCNQKAILTEAQLEQASKLYNEMNYVKRFESQAAFTLAHMTNIKSTTCEQSDERIARLKQLLNL